MNKKKCKKELPTYREFLFKQWDRSITSIHHTRYLSVLFKGCIYAGMAAVIFYIICQTVTQFAVVMGSYLAIYFLAMLISDRSMLVKKGMVKRVRLRRKNEKSI